MHDLYNLKEMLCKELSDYGKDGGLSLSSLDTIDKLAHAAKNVAKLLDESDGYSRRDYSRDGYYYDDGNSYRRGRDRMGRFVSRDGSEMARKLREMMNETTDDGLKAEIRRLAEKMDSM